MTLPECPCGLDPTLVVVPGPEPNRCRVQAAQTGAVLASPYQVHLLLQFSEPKSPAEVLARFSSDRLESQAFLSNCLQAGLLRPKEPAGGLSALDRVAVPTTFCQTPALEEAHGPPAFCFLGIPFDGNTTGQPGARFGPASIRAASVGAQYQLDPATRVPVGFFDYGQNASIAAGVTLADAGDVLVSAGEDCVALYSRVSDVIRDLQNLGTIPIVLGGDHSMTAPILEGLPPQPFQILHLDAHTDLGWIERPDETGLHHGNVFSVVLRDQPQLQRLVQAGLRGIVDGTQGMPQDRVTSIGMDILRSRGWSELFEQLDPKLPTYVSVDIDVVDPAFAPATGTPVPGGLLPHELKSLLREVGQKTEVMGADFMEVGACSPTDATGVVAFEAVLSLVGGICDRVLLGQDAATKKKARSSAQVDRATKHHDRR